MKIKLYFMIYLTGFHNVFANDENEQTDLEVEAAEVEITIEEILTQEEV